MWGRRRRGEMSDRIRSKKKEILTTECFAGDLVGGQELIHLGSKGQRGQTLAPGKTQELLCHYKKNQGRRTRNHL